MSGVYFYFLVSFVILFVLMMIGYKYSLLHDVSQLPYLQTPETLPPFTRFITYVFMCIGILPTILVILFTGFFCQTTYPAGVVLYTCFERPFAMADSSGYTAYMIACVLSVAALYYITTTIISHQKPRP